MKVSSSYLELPPSLHKMTLGKEGNPVVRAAGAGLHPGDLVPAEKDFGVTAFSKYLV